MVILGRWIRSVSYTHLDVYKRQQLGETEIGQGADTAFAQMAASTLGIPLEGVHVISNQDTDLTPFGTGAYASRQTYVALADKKNPRREAGILNSELNLSLQAGYVTSCRAFSAA